MKTGLKAGKLRSKVTFKKRQLTSDDQGGKSEANLIDISTDPNQWASIKPVVRREQFDQMQLQGNVTHKITTRYRRFADAGEEPVKLLIVYLAPGDIERTFKVLGVIDKDERHWRLDWLCEEQQANGPV